MINTVDYISIQAALAQAGLTGARVVIPGGTYAIPGPLLVPSGVDIDTDGRVIINTTYSGPIFDCMNAADWRIGGHMRLNGNGPTYTGYGTGPTTDIGQCGIRLSNSDRYEIGGKIEIANMQGAGILRTGSNAWQHQGRIAGVRISNCLHGIHSLTNSEYETISDAMISNCVFGILDEAGNNSYTNCKTLFCSIGVKLQHTTGNDAHGIFVGHESNHNTYNLVAQDVTLGETFSGCHFISDQSGSGHGIIVIVNSKGINISGGQMCSDIQMDATSSLSVQGAYIRPLLANLPTGIATAAPPALPPPLPSGAVFIGKNNWTDGGILWAGNN